MSRTILFALALAVLTTPPAFSAETAAPANSAPNSPGTATRTAPTVKTNPFFAPSTLPFGLPPFDLIGNDDYGPAYQEGMRIRLQEMQAIGDNPAAPSFQNTVEAMERSGRLLARVSSVFGNLTGANTNPAMEALDLLLAPQLAAHSDAVMLDANLFQRVQSVYDRRNDSALDAESVRLVERYRTDFVRAGATLSDGDKAKLKIMNAEIASLSATFSQNVLKEINASAVVVDNRAELDGLSPAEITAASDAATARGLPGKFVIALINTTDQPPEAVLTNRALRQRLHDVSVARGIHGGAFDNRGVIQKLVTLRAQRAALLGYPSHAAYMLEDQTARTTDVVNKLLADLAEPAVANARREAAAMQAVVDAEKGGFTVAAHDWAYYTEKVRKQRYDFDGGQLKPYLEFDSVLKNGVFFAAGKLYGLQFTERRDLPVYHPDVRVFDVSDADGKPLALFLLDPYARSNKRGGAWMNAYVSQSTLLDNRPVVANHLNIPKPVAGAPTLLSFDEVTTMFHEFGHALHGMFSNVTYPRFSGTNVPRDFVEYPSQVNEMWLVWPEVLSNYARHHQTGAPMPQALLDKVLATRTFNQGFATTHYLAAAVLDQRWHQIGANSVQADVAGFEAKVLKEAGLDFAPVPPRYRSAYFSHVFSSGYSAGYYSYIWSEVLDADTVEWFKKNGGLSRKNGDWFRQEVLSRGGSVDAIGAFTRFRGQAPEIAPLLARRGLTAPAAK
ncbi:MAG: M3 family metallopeptidase [Herminiimonas sp.]|nr:M3 family metallopeptidase [Herminiimonas sp.]